MAKKTTDSGTAKTPMAMLLAVIISVLPVLAWPFYMIRYNFGEDDGNILLALLFPIYIVMSGYLAYRCYRIRPEISYVLLSIMWLSYGAALLL